MLNTFLMIKIRCRLDPGMTMNLRVSGTESELENKLPLQDSILSITDNEMGDVEENRADHTVTGDVNRLLK